VKKGSPLLVVALVGVGILAVAGVVGYALFGGGGAGERTDETVEPVKHTGRPAEVGAPKGDDGKADRADGARKADSVDDGARTAAGDEHAATARPLATSLPDGPGSGGAGASATPATAADRLGKGKKGKKGPVAPAASGAPATAKGVGSDFEDWGTKKDE